MSFKTMSRKITAGRFNEELGDSRKNRPGLDCLVLLVFFPSVISSVFTQNKGGPGPWIPWIQTFASGE